MFLDFYKLREQPFGVNPDPKYLYFSPSHREALASLFYGIETGRGFLALIAEPGMGKTSLLFQLLERLKDTVRSAFLFQTQCDSRELLRYLLEALGIHSQETDLVRLHARLNEFLLNQADGGRRVVVFIDEAQNLTDAALETVRLLSNFEACDRKLLQIVLSGQPELARRLKNPALAQLSQRVAVLAGLKRLPATETFQYIQHRLEVAGYDGPEVFNTGALALIADRSQGIPRNINSICFNSMSLACAMGTKKIGPEIVREALNDLSLDCLVRKSQSVRPLNNKIDVSPRFSLDWLRSKLLENRVVQTAILSALLGSVATYLGVHTASGQLHSTSAASLTSDSATQAKSALPDAERSPSQNGNHLGATSQFFTHVVQPDDTIWNLCVESLGRYDQATLAELRKLNPELVDPDRIEVGQQIRLPVHPSNQEQR
jgi:general secretion pathway protein A